MAKAEAITVGLELSEDFKGKLAELKQVAADGVIASAVDAALRQVISHVDYDTHKYIECDEETEKDKYPELVAHFIKAYKEAAAK